MKYQEILNVDGIGEVKVTYSRRARNMSIRIKPFIGIIVTLPHGLSISHAVKLVKEKKDWISTHIKKIEDFEKTYTIFDENSNFAIRSHVLAVKRVNKGSFCVKVKDRLILANVPFEKEIRSLEIQEKIRKGIITAMRKEAKLYLPKRVDEFSKKFGLPYKELFIKNIKSRWGSCSGRNNINLSLHLMMLPDHLVDYVILHELAHIKIKNHSKKYWEFLDQLVNGAKQIDKELRQYKIGHY